MRSTPIPPPIVSLPAPPSTVSLPWAAAMLSLPSLPWIWLAKPLPVSVAPSALVDTRFSTLTPKV
ncbi:MAG: hypothetical protein CVU36_12790 [Betaproteobacteria bacterium HGW-Betaproteobacteria-9]|nr:MAG: hypothetical protein CVU36_12790 [Betaproteobacteria bacterium HGW-Betaproteobacteria-9]